MAADHAARADAAELAAEVRRVADRLRTLSGARLAGAVAPYGSRAAAGRAAAQALADAAQGHEDSAAPSEPQWRAVPAVSDFAVGDLVAVTGYDVLAAAAHADPDEQVWARSGRRSSEQVLAEVAALLAEVRRLL